jgi:sterol-4alpha-carboxylate 3-dehydrogenase (decarboxylating)
MFKLLPPLQTRVILLLLVGIYIYLAKPAIPNGPTSHSKQYLNLVQNIREKYPIPAIEKHSFLVIGGTGFTGGVIVDDLIARKAKHVRVISRNLPKEAKRKAGVEYVTGSITNLDALKKAMKDITIVYHTAAAYGNPPHGRFGDYEESPPYKVNVGGMKNIIEACEDESNTVRLLVYTSSMHTTFIPGFNQFDVDGYTVKYNENHHDFYSKSKIEAEKICLSHDNPGGKLRTIALRPSGIYGPQENYFIPKIINMFYTYGKYVPVYFDKNEIFEFTFVYNIAWGHDLSVAALDKLDDEEAENDAKKSSPFGQAFFLTDQEVSYTYAIFCYNFNCHIISIQFPHR